MSLLTLAKRAEVVAHLCEGAGVRPCARLCDVSPTTVLSLLLKMGVGCDRLHDLRVRDLDIRDVQVDEIWSFIQKKAARVQPGDNPTWGDAYTFLGIARVQKLIISYRVGKRDEANTQAFMRDLRARLVTVPHLATDAFAPYRAAVGDHFEAVEYGQVVKNYSRSPRRVRDGQPSYGCRSRVTRRLRHLPRPRGRPRCGRCRTVGSSVWCRRTARPRSPHLLPRPSRPRRRSPRRRPRSPARSSTCSLGARSRKSRGNNCRSSVQSTTRHRQTGGGGHTPECGWFKMEFSASRPRALGRCRRERGEASCRRSASRRAPVPQ
jgi:hypothetical protein